MRNIDPDELVSRHEGLLLDAFGVLVDSSGRLDVGRQILDALRAEGKPFCVVTNDASRLPETASRRFRSLGLEIAPDQVLSSGALLRDHFDQHALQGARTRVHGPEDSVAFVVQAGGVPLPADSDEIPDALVVCDERGFDFLQGIDRSLTLLIRGLEAGRLPHLVLANTDLQFPHGSRSWGFTAGAIALLLEAALARHFHDASAPRFHRLGKPGADLLERAMERLETSGLAMVGDQLDTDIAAAHAAGIPSALVTRLPPPSSTEAPMVPDYLIDPTGLRRSGTSPPSPS